MVCMYSQRTQVLLTPAQRLRLEQLARERHVSVGSLIRDAVDAYTSVQSRPLTRALDDLLESGAPVDEWPAKKEEIRRGLARARP
jgi:hypothetical protein